MKLTQNTRVVSGGRRGGSVYSQARGKTAAVTREIESGEVAACSLARERKRRHSLALGPLRDRGEPLLSRCSCLQLDGRPRCLDSMRGARAQKIT